MSFVSPQSDAFPRAEAHRLTDDDSPPVLDGDLNEPIWQRMGAITEFHQIKPGDGAPPSEQTEVRLAYDADFLYIGVKAFDATPERITANGLIQGQTFFSDDRFEVRLDTFDDRRNAYFFQVNANGIRREALLGNDYFIEEWDTVWFADARRQPWGWSAEIVIPFKSLSFDPGGKRWGLNLSRIIPRKGEEVSWSSRERRITPAVSGYLDGLTGLRQGLGLELVPTLTVTSGDGRNGKTAVEPSLTGFYRFNPFLTGALTLNTDFSATEADARQINLSRFSLFFPEKRDFFLRDAGIFEFGGLAANGRPFFSRRIGLSANGEPLDLEVGAKLTGRAGDWNIGVLAAEQTPGGPGADEHLFVGRISRNLLGESAIGLIATKGDPLNPADNALAGLDVDYQDSDFLGGRTLLARAWLQRSDTKGLDGGEAAYGATLAYPNDRVDWFVEWRRIGRHFRPGLGFVNRTDVREINAQWRFRHRRDAGRWQWLGARVQGFRAERLDGPLQSQSIFLNLLEGVSRGNDFFTVFAGEETENLETAFELFPSLVIPPGRYVVPRYGFFLETGQQRALAGTLEVVDGEFFDGRNLTLVPTLTWRPSRHLAAGLDYVVNRIELPQGRRTSRLYRLRADIAFNADWAWLNFVQGDNISDSIGLNSRLRWQPRADREIFLVLNRLRDADGASDTEVALRGRFNFRI